MERIVLAILVRVLSDLAILASVIAAAVLADHGKSWWVWSAFLLFGVLCLVVKVLVLAPMGEAFPTRKPRA